MSWHCEHCRKPKTIEKLGGVRIVGCEHIAILTLLKEDKMADPRDFGKLDPNCGAGCTGPMTTDVKPVSAPEDNWKHRSRTMKCLTCMYFVEKESTCLAPTPDYLVGRCRRHAPTMSGWPVMRGGDWCGDHKLDENKV